MKDSKKWFDRGNRYFDQKNEYGYCPNYKKAIECFAKAVEIDPKDVKVWSKMGYAYWQLSFYERAIECYEKAVAIDPKHYFVWCNMGYVYTQLKNYEKAYECYDKALLMDPNNIELPEKILKISRTLSHDSLLRIKKKNRKPEEKKFEDLLRTAKPLVKEGNEHHSKEYYSEAISEWRNAIKNYELAKINAPTDNERTKINENIRIIKKSICAAHIENGKKHDIIAKEVYDEINFLKAREEWIFAKNEFISALELIKSENFKFPQDQIFYVIESIERNLRKLEIEESILHIDNELKKARSLQDNNLMEAIKIAHISLAKYLDAKKKAEAQPEFKELEKVIQGRFINVNAYLSELQSKMNELLGIKPIEIKIDLGDVGEKISEDMRIHLCPYCGYNLSQELIQQHLNGEGIKCPNCEVEIEEIETIETIYY